jgi:NhaP-type Na+/H+ or K+/H+ antiporter
MEIVQSEIPAVYGFSAALTRALAVIGFALCAVFAACVTCTATTAISSIYNLQKNVEDRIAAWFAAH